MRLTLLVALLALPVFAFAQGTLAPIGPPALSMKTLDQIEPRIPLGLPGQPNTAPLTISASGSYVLMGNLTVGSGAAITISADDVTLDLNGFTIASSNTNAATGYAIYLFNARQNIAIRNGHLNGGATVNASGTATNIGFQYGIFCNSTLQNCLVSDLTVRGMYIHGIYLDKGSSVVRCVVQSCGATGIFAQVVADCSVTACGLTGIHGDTVSNCQSFGYGACGIFATYSATNCYGESTGGIGINAKAAVNCYGKSVDGIGITASQVTGSRGESTKARGINAQTVTGSYGLSTNENGVNCTVAADSFGSSTNLTGLSATTATNCFGYSFNGWGLFANEATNCHGESTNGTRGLHAEYTATGCYGKITSATDTSAGLYAHTASSCYGEIGTAAASCPTAVGLDAYSAFNSYGLVGEHQQLGYGLRASSNAMNCTGYLCAHTGPAYVIPGINEDPSTGLFAGQATNSSGVDLSGRYGLTATTVASFCSGYSFNGAVLGTAIKANLAFGCVSQLGPIAATHSFVSY